MATRSKLLPDAAAPAVRRTAALAALLAGVAVLAGGCMSSRTMTVAEDQETFGSAATYSRSLATATTAEACEAARRALLSQGYLIVGEKADQVQGRKHFQPQGDVHVELELRIVCLPEAGGRAGALAFATALQERYALKKSSISASLGLAAFGSLSLPLASSDDSLVRVASRTVTAATFYERFFALVERYLPDPSLQPAAASAASRPATGSGSGSGNGSGSGTADADVQVPAAAASAASGAAARSDGFGGRAEGGPASRRLARHATIWLSSTPAAARSTA